MPSLLTARIHAAACHLKDNLYVFCGIGERGNLNSIEKLCLTAARASWQFVVPVNSELTPRAATVVVVFNSEEIAILGGTSANKSYLSEVCLFNPTTNLISKVVDNNPSYKFVAIGNQAARISKNVVVALVRSADSSPTLV